MVALLVLVEFRLAALVIDGKAIPEEGLNVGNGIRVEAPVSEPSLAVEPFEGTLEAVNLGEVLDGLLESGTFGGVLVGKLEGESAGEVKRVTEGVPKGVLACILDSVLEEGLGVTDGVTDGSVTGFMDG